MDAAVARDGLTAGQYRAARAMLGWSLIEAARRADVSPVSILALERGMSTASETGRKAVADAYEAAGISFHGSIADGLGVLFKPPAAVPSSSSP